MPRAIRIDAPGRLRIVSCDAPAPAAGEALVRVAWAGICGSDRELLEGRRPQEFARYPIVPGHEWSGTVEDVGPGTDRELIGRPVVGEGFRSCQVCAACRRGEPSVCDSWYDETGFTTDGAWAEYLTLPARLLHVLPDGADLRPAAVLEPAACMAEACLRAATVLGERVAVVGAGTLGLLATQLLRAASPAELLLVDPKTSRTDLALRCGATSLISPEQADHFGDRFDVVVEAAGAGQAAALATHLGRRGARVVLTGIPATDGNLSARQLVTKRLGLSTVFGAPSRAWVHAVRCYAAGVLDPSLLISHEFALEDADKALCLLSREEVGVGKVLLHP